MNLSEQGCLGRSIVELIFENRRTVSKFLRRLEERRSEENCREAEKGTDWNQGRKETFKECNRMTRQTLGGMTAKLNVWLNSVLYGRSKKTFKDGGIQHLSLF